MAKIDRERRKRRRKRRLIYTLVFVLVVMVLAIVRRANHPVLKLLSNFGDFATLAVTALPLLTGMLASAHVGLRYETMLAIHLLSFSLLLIWNQLSFRISCFWGKQE